MKNKKRALHFSIPAFSDSAFSIFLFIIAIPLCLSCVKNKAEDEIIPPSSPPYSRSILGWGVINSSYTHILTERGEGSRPEALLRRGTIVEILERRPLLVDGKAESWVKAAPASSGAASGALPEAQKTTAQKSGWIKEAELRVFETYLQAKTASDSLEKTF